MRMVTQSRRFRSSQCGKYFLAAALVVVFLILSGSQDANALPAFARKYGLRCSACHETWPILNNFGLKFRDNGYQLMNDRDSPIWQNPGYWPVTFRITPIWHRVSSLSSVDTYTGITTALPQGMPAVERITTTGFDLSGLDFHTGGTLERNISFYVLPSSDPTAAFHFETVMGRFDNLFGTPWLNVKMGRFELNNLLSEKRMVGLTANGGEYQTYHFIPQGDGNIFGQMGDNQLGLEYVGHSNDDRTRISAALLSSADGNVNLTFGNAYSSFLTFDQGIDLGKLGVDRLGAYAFLGEASTYFRTSAGVPIPGSAIGNKNFSREGFTGQFYFGPHFNVNVVTQHGSDNAWFGQGYGNAIGTDGNGGVTCVGVAGSPGCPPNNTPGTVLPVGAQSPTWNGVTFENRYVYSPQLIFIVVYEAERMSRQANGANYTLGFTGPNGFTGPMRSNLGNINNYNFIVRYNPFMSSRAGMALQAEFNVFHQIGTGPLNTNTNSNELLLAWDLDF